MPTAFKSQTALLSTSASAEKAPLVTHFKSAKGQVSTLFSVIFHTHLSFPQSVGAESEARFFYFLATELDTKTEYTLFFLAK
jgi:hypothetical protein